MAFKLTSPDKDVIFDKKVIFMKKTLYLMRHGQTLFNRLEKIQGWCDSPLTDLGMKQAQVAKDYFKENKIIFDYAYCSTMERTCDTLEIVTEGKVPYTRTKGLKEFYFGEMEGESQNKNPPFFPYGDYFKQFGGETDREFYERIIGTLSEIMENGDYETILAVSHGVVCYYFLKYWGGIEEEQYKKGINNCGILKFEYENGLFSCVEVINHDFSGLE